MQQNLSVKKHRDFKASVLAAMVRRGWKQRDLAAAIGKGRTAISQAINAGKFPKVRQAITKALHLHN